MEEDTKEQDTHHAQSSLNDPSISSVVSSEQMEEAKEQEIHHVQSSSNDPSISTVVGSEQMEDTKEQEIHHAQSSSNDPSISSIVGSELMEDTNEQERHHVQSSSNEPSISSVESPTMTNNDKQSDSPSTTPECPSKPKGKLLDKIQLFQVKNRVPSLDSPQTCVTPNYRKYGTSDGNLQHKRSKSFQSSDHDIQAIENKVLIDTTMPFDSVKSEVSKFGGIVDWKAHKSHIEERHKNVEVELSQTLEEIPRCKKQSLVAEEERDQVLKELDSTRKLIEELKMSLEKAQTEEAQAKQDSQLVFLRLHELGLGISGKASPTAQAELDITKARHAAAVLELDSVQKELEATRKDYAASAEEKEVAIIKAQEVASASKDIEKRVENLTLELIAVRDSLESAHTAHMEAEEHRLDIESAKDKEVENWKKHLQLAEDELQNLNQKVLSMKDLQSKLDAASLTLLSLKNELESFAEAKISQESQSILVRNPGEIKEISRKHLIEKELEEVKGSIEKAQEEVNYLRVAAVSLKAELEAEESAFEHLKQKEKTVPEAVSSLQAEIYSIEEEIKHFEAKEQEARNQNEELPISLEQASREAEEARSLAQLAQAELQKAKEELEQVKASVNIAESRLHAALKEIEAAKSSEQLANAAIKALQESQPVTSTGVDELKDHISLRLEEYYALSKKAHDAEQAANESVASAFSQVEAATDSEANILEKLAEATKELEERKEALKQAMGKVYSANEGKLAVEQELRQWRATNEQRRHESSSPIFSPSKSPRMSFEEHEQSSSSFVMLREARGPMNGNPSTRSSATSGSPESNAPHAKTKKKKSFFPRFVMFLARKKSHKH